MCISSYGLCFFLITGLWALWLAVLCAERKWFREMLSPWRAMSRATRIFMLALCVYYTVKAQKPAAPEGGGTNAAQGSVQQAVAEGEGADMPQAADRQTSGDSAFETDTAVGTAAGRAASGTRSGLLAVFSEPSRVVLQSALADDPTAIPVFADEPGWAAPFAVAATPELDALSFDGAGPGIPSPVCFTGATNAAVQTVILAVRGSATNLATLADAPETARLRIAAEGDPVPDMTAAERALTESLTPDQWQVAEIDFDEPANLAVVFFGGSAGRPEWLRNWRGEIAEAVGFSTSPDGDVRAGVANYLSIRWGFGGHPANAQQRQAAINAGLNSGHVWGTILFFK